MSQPTGTAITDKARSMQDAMIGFLRDIVAIPSLSGQEENQNRPF